MNTQLTKAQFDALGESADLRFSDTLNLSTCTVLAHRNEDDSYTLRILCVWEIVQTVVVPDYRTAVLKMAEQMLEEQSDSVSLIAYDR